MRHFKKIKGVTLIEVLVTLALFMIFYATFLFAFPTLNAVTTFNARMGDFSSDLRLTQFSGASRGGLLSGRNMAGASVINKNIYGDGIVIVNSSSTAQATYFYDVESGTNSLGVGKSNKYNDVNDIYNKTFPFQSHMFLNRTRVKTGVVWSDVPLNATTSVTYVRPETQANIVVINGIATSTPYDSVCFEFRFDILGDIINKRSITIEKFGQINSYSNLCN